jgi:hypothetical protein
MNAKLSTLILCALVLMDSGAIARDWSAGGTHVGRLSHAFHEYPRREMPPNRSSGGLYESYSQGHQSYPNPDRELYVNRSCCS